MWGVATGTTSVVVGHHVVTTWYRSERYKFPFAFASTSASTTFFTQLSQPLHTITTSTNMSRTRCTDCLSSILLLTTLSSISTEEKNPANVIRGLKSAITNPNVSEEAKQRDRERLQELGQDIGAGGQTPEGPGHESLGRPEGESRPIYDSNLSFHD